MNKALAIILTLVAIVCGFSACSKKEEVIIQSTETTRVFTAPVETIPDLFGEPIDEPITDAFMQEPRLSDSCDKILYTTQDGTDYYEFVVNEEINYPKNTYSFGVIKNNQWLVEMSTQSPFLNEDNTWKSLENCSTDPLEKISFGYLGEGCFLYYTGYYNINSSAIIYNPATNVSFPVKNISYYKSITDAKESSRFENILNDEQVIVSNQSLDWVILNTTTGETRPVNGYLQEGSGWYIDSLQGNSEGLFFMICHSSWPDKTIFGFFNLNGELVIDLTEYEYDAEADYRFVNGQCSFITSNTNGVKFKITIDKTGQILSSEQV